MRALPHSSHYRLPAYNATWEKLKVAEPKGPHAFPSFLQWEEIGWKGHGELLLLQEAQDSGQSIQTNPLHRRGSLGQTEVGSKRQEGKIWGTIRNLQRWLSVMEILAPASPQNLPSAMPTFLATTVGSVAPNTAHHTVSFMVHHPQCQFQEGQDIFLLCHCCALWLQLAPGHSGVQQRACNESLFHQHMCLNGPGHTSLGKLRQKGHKLKAYLGYIMKLVCSLVRPCLDIKVKGELGI